MKENLYYFVMSGRHPCLSRAELETLCNATGRGSLVTQFTQVALYRLEGGDAQARRIQVESSTIKEAGKVIALTEQDISRVAAELSASCETYDGRLRVDVKRIQSLGQHMDINELRRVVAEKLRVNRNRKPESTDKATRINVILTDGIVIVGEVLSDESKGPLLLENPHDLPFYKPGALNPWFSRILVNLARTPRTRKFVDAFCGVGSIALHAVRLNIKETLCGDASRLMCWGCLVNFRELCSKTMYSIVRWDATRLPLRDESVESLASDLPYGRSVKTISGDTRMIAEKFIVELERVLVKGGRAVLSMPMGAEPDTENISLKVKYKCPMYVHSRLSRTILVLEK